MRHPLNWIVRAAVPNEDRAALLGDIEEEYTQRVLPAHGWVVAQLWYSGQVIAAGARGWATDHDQRKGWAPLHRRLFGGHDIRHALRRWRHRPAFALTAIATLALGIAATTSIFSIVDAVLLRPLPWVEPDRIVAIHAVFPERRQNPASALTWNRGSLSFHAWDGLRREPMRPARSQSASPWDYRQHSPRLRRRTRSSMA
ncbi:MAG TPA: hypothetical protein VES67_02715 [Vicinamibacterales bacterium]|nr:hypothetical protein [Vicinamibacterales bacterium]